jgi:N-acetyl sugar amidotransferase
VTSSGTANAKQAIEHGGQIEPAGYRMCTRTVMDTTDPDIVFDEHGVSNHWHEYQEIARTQLLPPERARDELTRIVATVQRWGKNNKYDCVLGLSGGVDSSYLAHLAVESGLRPLLVHFDNGWNTELAVNNIERLVNGLGLDLFTFVMDWPEFRDLQRSYFMASVLDLDVPTDHMIFGALYKIARSRGLKVILSGANIVTEAILPRRWYYPKFDMANLRDIHRRYGSLPLRKLPAMGLAQMIYYGAVYGITQVKLLDLVPYQKQAAKRLLTEKYGWRDYGGKHYESIFTRFYQGYILPRKFNIDKRKAHLSNLICSGQQTRSEAIEELERPTYEPQLQKEDKTYVAKKLGFTDDEFEHLLTLPNRSHSEFATDARWRKRYFSLMRGVKPITSRLNRFRRRM